MAEKKTTKFTDGAVLMMLDIDRLADIEQRFFQIGGGLRMMCMTLYSHRHVMARRGEPEEGLCPKAYGMQTLMNEEKLMFNHIAGGRLPIMGRGRLTRKRCVVMLHGCAV